MPYNVDDTAVLSVSKDVNNVTLLIEVYKILTNKYDSRVTLYLEKQQDSITRGHSLKLANNIYQLNSTNHPKRKEWFTRGKKL